MTMTLYLNKPYTPLSQRPSDHDEMAREWRDVLKWCEFITKPPSEAFEGLSYFPRWSPIISGHYGWVPMKIRENSWGAKLNIDEGTKSPSTVGDDDAAQQNPLVGDDDAAQQDPLAGDDDAAQQDPLLESQTQHNTGCAFL